MKKKIALLGSNGQLGKELQALFANNNTFELTPLSRQDVDISKKNAAANWFLGKQYDIIINAAAYTAVDAAENDQENCYQCNEGAVKELAAHCKQTNCTLIHISTDFVFDGSRAQPLTETDTTNPLQVYGASKLAGEQWNKKGITIRTSWLYAADGKNFLNTMLRLGRERNSLNVVSNQVGTPTHAADLAQVILDFCKKDNLTDYIGLYHYSNEGVASWYDFAHAIMEYAHVNCQVLPIKDTDYPTPAKRPHFSLLDKSKIKETLQIEIPHWRESLQQCLQKQNS